MNIATPAYHVSEVIHIIERAGYDCYMVGGCVRDMAIGREPKDYDLATNALPETIIDLFPHVIKTGLKHGTVTVLIRNNPVEVTTLRCDGNYKDYRRPEQVIFTSDIQQDLSRRDFTMNAIAIKNEMVIDPFDGLTDISNKCIKAVGDPFDRFQEDALRMMRAVRFACQLGFSIEQNTLNEIKNNADLLIHVSAERVRDELNKIITSNYAGHGLRVLIWGGLMNYIIPELIGCADFDQQSTYHNKDVLNHMLSTVEYCDQDLVLRLSALLHDIAKPDCFEIVDGRGRFIGHEKKGGVKAENILKRLKYDNKTIEAVRLLVENHMYKPSKIKCSSLSRFINKIKLENIENLFKLQKADIKASAYDSDFSSVDYLQGKVMQFLEQKKPLTVNNLDINGYDLMKVGISEGPEIGRILNSLLEQVLSGKVNNKKTDLMRILEGVQ